MQVNKGTEGALFAAGEQPVNRAFFVGFVVIADKFIDEVAADALEGGFAYFAIWIGTAMRYSSS